MTIHSQGKEQETIVDYFNSINKPLNEVVFMDLGANSGTHLSNTRYLAECGASGLAIEPSPRAFDKLQALYKYNMRVTCFPLAVGDNNELITLYESDVHLNQGDIGLLSSVNKKETQKWRATTRFNEVLVEMVDVPTLLMLSPLSHYDFISLDCEGNDILILEQMDLYELGCKIVCVEYNGYSDIEMSIRAHCAKYGLTNELLKNAENIIFAK